MNGLNDYTNDINFDVQHEQVDTSSNINLGVTTRGSNNNVPVSTDTITNAPVESYNPLASEVPEGCSVYIAQAGDTFISIARVNDVDVDELKRLNSDIDGDISEGDIVYIPMKDIQMTPQEASGGGGGSDALNDTSTGGAGNLGGSSGGGGGGSSSLGSDGDTRNITTDDSFYDGSDYDNSSFNIGDTSQYAQVTSDLRTLNLNQLDEISDFFENRMDELLREYNYTKDSFETLISDALTWGFNYGYSLENMEMADIIYAYICENPVTFIDYNTLTEALDCLRIINRVYDEVQSRVDPIYSDEPYSAIIDNTLRELGYDVDSLSVLEKVKLIKEKGISLVENLLIPEDYDDKLITAAYLFEYLYSLIPVDENYDPEEALGNYKKVAVEILKNVLGEDFSNDNIFELSNLICSNSDAINEFFLEYGLDLTGELGIAELFTGPMTSIAYSMIKDHRDLFVQYLDANYSEEVKVNALSYYDDGNYNSALYVLQLDDLETSMDRLDEIEIELYSDDLFVEMDEYGLTYYGQLVDLFNIGAFDIDYCYNAIKEKINRYYELKYKEELTDSELRELSILESDQYSILFDERTEKFISLYEERAALAETKEQYGSIKYQLEQAVKINSFEYLDSLIKTDEYIAAFKNRRGLLFPDPYCWDSLDYILSDTLSGVELYEYTYSSLSNYHSLYSDLFDIQTILENIITPDDDDETDIMVKVRTNMSVYNLQKIYNIEEVNYNESGEVELKFSLMSLNGDCRYVVAVYDQKTGQTKYRLEGEEGQDFGTYNLENFDYRNINYFEYFNHIAEVYGMTREEVINYLSGGIPDDVQPNDPINIALMCYEYFTDEQINHYYYLYQVEGPERANYYLTVMRDSVHQKIGMQNAVSDIEFIMSGAKGLNTFAVGLNNGLTGWIDNVRTFLDRDVIMTPTEYEQQYLLEILQSFATSVDISKVKNSMSDSEFAELCSLEDPTFLDYYHIIGRVTDDQYNNLVNDPDFVELKEYAKEHPKVINYSYVIGQNLGNMLPAIMASAAFAPLGGVSVAGHTISFGKAAASVALFAGCYGGAYKEAVRNSVNDWRADAYAFLKAASEVATEYFIGRTPGLGRVSEVVNPIIGQSFKQLLGMVGINMLKTIGGELAEESLQIWIDYILDSALVGKTIDLSKWPEEQLDTAIVTIFTTLILSAPHAAKNLVKGFSVKIDGNVVNLSFAEVMELNEKFVDSETGNIDLEGLQAYLSEKMILPEPAVDPNRRIINNAIDYAVRRGYDRSNIVQAFYYALYGKVDYIRDSHLRESLRGMDKQLLLDYYNHYSGQQVNNNVRNQTQQQSQRQSQQQQQQSQQQIVNYNNNQNNSPNISDTRKLSDSYANSLNLPVVSGRSIYKFTDEAVRNSANYFGIADPSKADVYCCVVPVNGIPVSFYYVLKKDENATRNFYKLFEGAYNSLKSLDPNILKSANFKEIALYDYADMDRAYIEWRNRGTNAAGVCTPGSNLVRWYSKNGTLGIIHEMGHALDHILNLSSNRKLQNLAKSSYGKELARLRVSGYYWNDNPQPKDKYGNYYVHVNEFWADMFLAYYTDYDRFNMIGYDDKTGKGVLTKYVESVLKTIRVQPVSNSSTITNPSRTSPVDLSYKTYDNYDEFVDSMADNRETMKQLDEASYGRLDAVLSGYISNDLHNPSNYQYVNGILRDDTFYFNGDTLEKVVIHGSGGFANEYIPKQFKKQYGSGLTMFKSASSITVFLSEQMDQCPIGQDTQFIRGINWDSLSSYGISEGDSEDVILEKLQAAGHYVEQGFMSCCPNIDESDLPGVLTNKPIKLILNVKGTTGGMDLSHYNRKEKEVLLDCGLSFTPTKVEAKGKYIYIYLDQD